MLYGADRFGWDAVTIGVSIFGVSTALCQALLVGAVSRRFGDLGTVMIGVGFDALAYLSIAFANQSWMGLRSRRCSPWAGSRSRRCSRC